MAITESQWLACTEPQEMLAWLQAGGRLSDRKAVLFGVACCRRVLFLLTRDYVAWCPRAIEVHERYADGFAAEEELRAIKAKANGDSWDAAGATGHPGEVDYYAVFYAAYAAQATDPVAISRDAALAIAYDAVARANGPTVAAITDAWERAGFQGRARWDEDQEAVATLPAFLAAYAAERARQADLLRCIFGNPCQPVSPSLLMAKGHLIRVLAHAAYDDRKLPEGTFDTAALAAVADALEANGCTDSRLVNHLRSPMPHVRGCIGLDLILSRGSPL